MPMPVEVENVNGAANVKPATAIVAVAGAEVIKPGFVHASVFPEKERPPLKVVVCNFPFTSAESKVFVATEKIVELLKVAVELKAAPPAKACNAVPT